MYDRLRPAVPPDGWAAGDRSFATRRHDLARTLTRLGCWSYLPPERATAAEHAVSTGTYPFLEEVLPDIQFAADGEELAEGGVEELLALMEPTLRDRGLVLQVKTLHPESPDDEEYVVEVNGRRCLILDGDDWVYGRPWYEATVRPLAVVNDLLAEAGATTRVFVLRAGDNGATAFILDPRVVDAIGRSGLLDAPDLPALVVDDTRA